MGELLNAMLSDVIDEPSHNDKEYLIEKYVTKK
jgi:tRNA nucleotidyltransferase (CCA-adding enzyme)